MAKPNPYIKAALEDRSRKIFDDEALTTKELIEIRNEGERGVYAWLRRKIQDGEWEMVYKRNKMNHPILAYRPKKK